MNIRSVMWIAPILGASAIAALAADPFSLAKYAVFASYPLPAAAAAEASAVTYNPATDTLLVVGDEAGAIVEVDRTGQLVSVMTMSGFQDTEGVTCIGGGQFVIVEERLQDATRFTYVPGGSIKRSDLPTVSLGPTIGNTGLEGLSFNPLTGEFIFVKEKSPIRVIAAKLDFQAGTVQQSDLFTPNLGVTDIADVQHLATVPTLVGTLDQDNLLILSQESSRLLEVSPTGQVLSSFDLSPYASTAEGVTIAPDRTIFVVDETPTLHVLKPNLKLAPSTPTKTVHNSATLVRPPG